MADETLMVNFSSPANFKAPKRQRKSFKARDKWAQRKQAAIQRKASGQTDKTPPFRSKFQHHPGQRSDSPPPPPAHLTPGPRQKPTKSPPNRKHTPAAPTNHITPEKQKTPPPSNLSSQPAPAPAPASPASPKKQRKRKATNQEENVDKGSPAIGSPPRSPSHGDEETPQWKKDKMKQIKERRKEKQKERKREEKKKKNALEKSTGESKQAPAGVMATAKAVIKTSSLFRNNPDIPDVQAPSVVPLKEKVFTSDSFSELGLHPHLVATLNKVLGVTSMTSVQKQTIPVLLSGKDAVVRSQTGSGKTLAYGIPIVNCLQALDPKVKRTDGPLAVIIVPTRELAQQSFQIFQKLLKPFTWIVPGVLMGGEKRKAEKARLRKGINILVSTPGRLVDHIRNTLSIVFSSVKWLILDEADRTLDLGFEKDLTVILNALNAGGSSRQNVLLSATLTEGLSRLADISMKDPVSVHVSEDPGVARGSKVMTSVPLGAPGEGGVCVEEAEEVERFAIPEQLHQHMVVVPSKLRLVALAAFILARCKFENGQKLVVFMSSCEMVEFLLSLLSTIIGGGATEDADTPPPKKAKQATPPKPISFLRLHGNMKQEERMEVFQEFSHCKSGVLLCTDVAARGLDLPQVTWIVQYTPPLSVAEYVHRVGRTARIGAKGSSLLFLTPAEVAYVEVLANHNISLTEMKVDKVLSVLLRDDRFRGRGNWDRKKGQAVIEQETRERATVLQTDFENVVHASTDSVQTAKKALQSFVSAYTTYPSSLKAVFHLRSLHLGHAAKSFGLRDAPSNLASHTHTHAHTHKDKGKDKRRAPAMSDRKRVAHLLSSEFSNGTHTSLKKKRKKRSLQDTTD